jgi:cell wall-associated NlpC family hydrolase
VSVAKTQIRSSQSLKAPALAIVPRDIQLAIFAETPEFYGVLMQNKRLGWIPKTQVQLLDYQTEVTLGAATSRAQQPAPQQNWRAQPPTPPSSNDSFEDYENRQQIVARPPQIPPSEAPPATPLPSPTDPQAFLARLDDRTRTMLEEAFSYMGVRYTWGGESRSGLDCSAFVRNVYRKVGVSLPRVSRDQAQVGQLVDWNDLQPGDRLYFAMQGKREINHCGIYLGNGYFIHASSNQHKVGLDLLSKSNYYNNLICARR